MSDRGLGRLGYYIASFDFRNKALNDRAPNRFVDPQILRLLASGSRDEDCEQGLDGRDTHRMPLYSHIRRIRQAMPTTCLESIGGPPNAWRIEPSESCR